MTVQVQKKTCSGKFKIYDKEMIQQGLLGIKFLVRDI